MGFVAKSAIGLISFSLLLLGLSTSYPCGTSTTCHCHGCGAGNICNTWTGSLKYNALNGCSAITIANCAQTDEGENGNICRKCNAGYYKSSDFSSCIANPTTGPDLVPECVTYKLNGNGDLKCVACGNGRFTKND